MITYFAVFLAGFIRVFSAGFQSRNVNEGMIKLAAMTSFVIAASEGSIIALMAAAAVHKDWGLILVYGLSGSVGITLAMATHKKVHKRMRLRKSLS